MQNASLVQTRLDRSKAGWCQCPSPANNETVPMHRPPSAPSSSLKRLIEQLKEEIREDEQKLEKKASPVDTVVVRFNSNFDLTVNFPLNRAATVRADED